MGIYCAPGIFRINSRNALGNTQGMLVVLRIVNMNFKKNAEKIEKTAVLSELAKNKGSIYEINFRRTRFTQNPFNHSTQASA